VATTANRDDDLEEQELESVRMDSLDLEMFERLEGLVEQYDGVLVASEGSELYNKELYWDNLLETGFNAVPRMEAYDESLDMVEEINSLDGEVLFIGLGLDNEVPYVGERDSPEYRFEGNWWDNIADLEVDVLLDRTSYEGAVSIPYGVDIETFEPKDYSQRMYMVTQNNP